MVTLAGEREKESAANEGWSASVVPLPEEITGGVRISLLVLLGAVSLLLMMAIANVATLTIAGLSRRADELAVRRAIGATNRRLFHQLFTQSALLGALGAATGIAVAIPGVRLLVTLLPPDIPRPGSVAVDTPVLLVTTGLALAATLLFGSLAALRGRRAADAASLAAGTRAGRVTARRASLGLVAVEVALAGALGIMAMLTARSFAQLTAVDLGFSPQGVVIARVALPGTYGTPESQRAFYERLVERVRALPAVTAAGIISGRPFGGIGPATTVRDAVRPADANGQDPVTDIRLVEGGTLEALGVPLERGTTFDARDVAGPPRVLVSATLARSIWPGQDAVGRTLRLEIYGGLTATVAGVVRDVHLFDARTPPRPLAYLPAARFPDGMRDLVVRVEGAPDAVVPSLRAAVAAIDPSLPLYAVTELSTLVDRSNARDRLTMLLLGGFGAVALLLAAVGVFGAFAGDVAARRKEIGIRLALGARPSGIVLLLLGRSARQVAIGLAAGGLTALVAGRGMQSLLFGVSAADPASFFLVCATVVALATVATVLPAWQALRRTPLATLREG